MRLFKPLILAVVGLFASIGLAQISVPQINLTGNLGCQGFPCVNNGTLIMASDANRIMTAQETSAFYIKVTSSVSLTATRNLISPTGRFPFTIENATTGGQSIQIIGTSGSGVTIPNGITVGVWNDGTNFVQIGAAGSGTGCIPSGSTNVLLKNGGSGTCVPSSITDNGTTVSTAELITAASFNGVALTTGGGTTNFLRADGTYAAPPSGSSGISGGTSGQAAIFGSATTITSGIPIDGAGAGLVTGPASNTINELAYYPNTDGRIADSTITITNVGTLSGTQTFTGNKTFSGTVTLPSGQVVNGVTLTTGGSTTSFLNANGAYSTPSGAGTVTSIATTSPITGGTITSTGTIACATCVVASAPGVGIAHFAGSTQTVTSSAVNLTTADVTGLGSTASIIPITTTGGGLGVSTCTYGADFSMNCNPDATHAAGFNTVGPYNNSLGFYASNTSTSTTAQSIFEADNGSAFDAMIMGVNGNSYTGPNWPNAGANAQFIVATGNVPNFWIGMENLSGTGKISIGDMGISSGSTAYMVFNAALSLSRVQFKRLSGASFLYVDATNEEAQLGTGTELSTLVQTLTGCNTATFVYTPQGNDCVAPSSTSISFPQTVGGTTTSGGIPYFSSTTVLTSSALLPTGDFVLGGGAGGAPTASFSVVPIANGGTGLATFAANHWFGNNTVSTAAPASSLIGTNDWSPNIYVVGAGSVNVMTATLTPAATALTAGLQIDVLPNLANTTTTPTLNVSGLGAKTITKCGTTALAAGDYSTTAVAEFVYDGTEMQLLNPQAAGCGSGGGGTPAYPLTITGGVSGGVVYGSTSTQLTVSPAGTANVLMKWGGAGNAPGSSSLTDNGTTLTGSESVTLSGNLTENALGTATSGSGNFGSYTFSINGSHWTGSAAAADDFTQILTEGTGTNPSLTSTLGFTTASTGTTQIILSSPTGLTSGAGVKLQVNARAITFYENGSGSAEVDGIVVFGNNASFTGALTVPSLVTTATTITASATPAMVATLGLQTITLSANATPTITGITSGQRYTIEICQPASGGPFTWTWPASVHGGVTIGTTASTCSIQSFDSFSGTTLVAESTGIINIAP